MTSVVMTAVAARAEHATKVYGEGDAQVRALDDLSLEIPSEQFTAIMGPSGSGKSTLMQILGLLDRPTSGSFRLLGQDVSRLSDDEGAQFRSKTIGFIFQMFNLLSRTSTLDNHRPGSGIIPPVPTSATSRTTDCELLFRRRNQVPIHDDEPLDTLVVGIGHVDRALAVDRDPA